MLYQYRKKCANVGVVEIKISTILDVDFTQVKKTCR